MEDGKAFRIAARTPTLPSFIFPEWPHKLAIHLLLLTDILYSSRIYRAVDDPILQTGLLSVFVVLGVLYSFLAILQRNYVCIAIAIIFVFVTYNQLQQFSVLSQYPVNYNSAGQLLELTILVTAGVISRLGLSDYLVKRVYVYAVWYTVSYTIVAIAYHVNILPERILDAIVLRDVERGERLFNYSTATAFAWFVCLYRVRRKFNLLHLSTLLICGLAVILTLSRVYIIFMLLLSVMYLVRFRHTTIRMTSLIILWSVSLSYFYGLLDANWNLFSFFATDSSGGTRALEYEIARSFIWQNPLWGIGFPPVPEAVGALTGDYYFAPNDLGTFGIWVDWGFIGLMLFFIGSHLVSRFKRGLSTDFEWPIFLTGCLLAGYGCIAPNAFYPGGATYFSIIVGISVDFLTTPVEARALRN